MDDSLKDGGAANQARQGNGGYLVIEGPLTELHVERGRQNLLAKIDAHYREKSAVIAAGAALTDQFGLFASSANLALYDGDSTQNFACLVGDKVVYGQFSGAQFLKVGNTVRAVVSRQGDGYLAHAILDRRQGYVWTSVPIGSGADTKFNVGIAKWVFLGGAVAFVISSLVCGGLSRDALDFALLGIGIWAAITYLVFRSANRATNMLTDSTSYTFRALGFAHPEDVDLTGFNIYWVDMRERTAMDRAQSKFAKISYEDCRDVFDYRLAIKKRKLKFVDGNDPHR